METDHYTLRELESYLNLMEQAARDWLREQLSDEKFMVLHHTRFSHYIHLVEDDPKHPASVDQAHQIEERLRHFRELRKLLDGIDLTIWKLRAGGQREADLLQKISLLIRCLAPMNFEYRPVTTAPITTDSHDPPPPPAASL